ncbi:hypothetical protein HDV00_000280 [Rhizophlyctis rosea]|nr:hypothetical protein HDV00_000280 [Rhizophlyctis rosea]
MSDKLKQNSASPEKRKAPPALDLPNSLLQPVPKRLKQEEKDPDPPAPAHTGADLSDLSDVSDSLFVEPISPDEDTAPVAIKLEPDYVEEISSDEEEEVVAKGRIFSQEQALQDVLGALGLLGSSSEGPPPSWLINSSTLKEPSKVVTVDRMDEGWRIIFEKASTKECTSRVNVVGVGVFDASAQTHELVAGCENGAVVFLDENTTTIDTKGGSIISLILDKTVHYEPLNIITGDSNGNVTLLSREQILMRRSIGAPITSLTVYTDQVGSKQIISGDSTGVVTAFTQHEQVWRTKVGGLYALNPRGKPILPQDEPPNPSIRCMIPWQWSSSGKGTTSTLLVCDGSPCVYVLVNGKIVRIVDAPCAINAMWKGYFSYLPHTPQKVPGAEQLLLGGENGCVYMFDGTKFHLYGKADFPIRTLHSCQSKSKDETEFLVVGGLSAVVSVFKDGNLVQTLTLPDFPSSISSITAQEGTTSQLVVGLANGTVDVYEVNFMSPDEEEGEIREDEEMEG